MNLTDYVWHCIDQLGLLDQLLSVEDRGEEEVGCVISDKHLAMLGFLTGQVYDKQW